MSGRFLKDIVICVIAVAFGIFIILYVIYKPAPSDNIDSYLTLSATLSQPPKTVHPSKGPTTIYLKVQEFPVAFSAELNESVDGTAVNLKAGDRIGLTILKEEYRRVIENKGNFVEKYFSRSPVIYALKKDGREYIDFSKAKAFNHASFLLPKILSFFIVLICAIWLMLRINSSKSSN